MERIVIQWTDAAVAALAALPHKVRRGLLDKASGLTKVDNPEAANKPLVGPLQGYFRICYSRYRAIYTIKKESSSAGVLIQITILFVAAGIRKEGDKSDVYRLAQRFRKLGLLEPGDFSK